MENACPCLWLRCSSYFPGGIVEFLTYSYHSIHVHLQPHYYHHICLLPCSNKLERRVLEEENYDRGCPRSYADIINKNQIVCNKVQHRQKLPRSSETFGQAPLGRDWRQRSFSRDNTIITFVREARLPSHLSYDGKMTAEDELALQHICLSSTVWVRGRKFKNRRKRTLMTVLSIMANITS